MRVMEMHLKLEYWAETQNQRKMVEFRKATPDRIKKVGEWTGEEVLFRVFEPPPECKNWEMRFKVTDVARVMAQHPEFGPEPVDCFAFFLGGRIEENV